MACAQILRQLFVALTLITCGISEGFIVGQMSGMVDALSSNTTDIKFTDDELSWMVSSINILCIFGFGLMGIITEALGRRKAITIASLPITACWVFIYFANTKTQLFTARILQGVCYGKILLMVYICVAEYQPPKFRALSLTLTVSVASLVGTTLGHILSILLNWRHVALIGVIPSALSAILPLFWVESPYWLAAKGHFKETEEAFNALRSPSKTSNYELELLLASERVKQSEISMNAPKVVLGKKILMALKQRYFWKLLLFSTIIHIYKGSSGRLQFNALGITMMQQITGTSHILLYTFAIDGLCIFGAVISCFFLRRFKVRPLFFVLGILANFILILLALCLYFLPGTDVYLSWTKVSLLSFYFVTVTAGPCPILDTLIGEIYPLEIKSFYLTFTGCIGGCIQFLSIKLLPNLISFMGYHGTFSMNACIIFICVLYMWFHMPETSDRSLSEIECYFKNNSFMYCETLLKSEQAKKMLNKI